MAAKRKKEVREDWYELPPFPEVSSLFGGGHFENSIVVRSFRSFSTMSLANGTVGRVTMKRMENGEWRMQSAERTPEGVDKEDHASTSKQHNSPGNPGSRGLKLNLSEIVENAKRTLGEADAEGNAATRKRRKYPGNAASCIQWKMW